MTKGIIVVDMPERCGECPVCASWQASALSVREYWCPKMECRGVEPYTKPDWCPIKPMPEEKTVVMVLPGDTQGLMESSQAHGWNMLREEILIFGGAADE